MRSATRSTRSRLRRSAPGTTGGRVTESLSLARDTIERVRVQRGFSRAWLKLYNSVVDQGWADMHAVLDRDKEVLRTYDSKGVANGDDLAEGLAKPGCPERTASALLRAPAAS